MVNTHKFFVSLVEINNINNKNIERKKDIDQVLIRTLNKSIRTLEFFQGFIRTLEIFLPMETFPFSSTP